MMNKPGNIYFNSIVLSYSQLFFSNKPAFGLALLIISFINPLMGITGLTAVILTNTFAKAAGYDQSKIDQGLFGYSGYLLGAGYVYFFEPAATGFVILLFMIVLIVYLIPVFEYLFYQLFKTGSFTVAFILGFYLMFALLNYIGVEEKLFIYAGDTLQMDEFFSMYFKSMGFILFQSDLIAGILVMLAVLIYSRVLFSLSILAYTFAFVTGYMLHNNLDQGVMLFSGFNSILTAFAVGGCLVIPSKSSLGFGFLGVIVSSVLSVLLYSFLGQFDIPVLVVPFNIAAILLVSSLMFRTNAAKPLLLYFAPGSPEQNLYYHLTRKSRFDKFKYYFPELPFFGEWNVSQGREGNITHKDDWKYAWDFIITDEKNTQFMNQGFELRDYYCYDAPVTAPLDGRVIEVINTVPDNQIGEANLQNNWGNTIIIDHYEGLFTALSHLKQNSAKVSPGDYVKKGDIIGYVGNSGRSPYPHAHFQFQKTPKLGEKTFDYPFAHFLEKQGSSWILRNFDHPAQDTVVTNLDTDKVLVNAFNFALGDVITVKGKIKGEAKSEVWKVGVTIYNELYLTSETGDTIYLYKTEKVSFFSNYIGTKKSLLYYFYLSALQIPLSSKNNLLWSDNFSPAHFPELLNRVFAEFFVFISNDISANASFSLTKPDSKTVRINSEISLSSAFRINRGNTYFGRLYIDRDSGLKSVEFLRNTEVIASFSFEDYERKPQ